MPRLVLGASGVAGAALALLPAVVATLVGLLDIGAHAVLGLAGAMLGTLVAWLPAGTGGGSGLPAYQAVAVRPLRVIGWSALRALGPAAMVLVAFRPPPRRRVAALAATAAALLGAAGVWPAVVLAPGVLAALRL